jgi:cell wall-associated NlpC family hydrolase
MTCQQIIVPVAGMRAEPRLDAALDNEGLFGETVKISETENGFACARLLVDGYEGWIDGTALGNLPAATAQVTVPMTHVTSTPDIKSPGLFTLSIGSAVQVRAPAGEMVEIAMADGSGFVPAGHLRALDDRAADWVAVAETLIASPYKWGGRSVFGLDCSALVQLALAAGGVRVPRDSGPQHDIGTEIAGLGNLQRGDLQRGDLIFWRGHVGIMLDPDRLLHANAYHMAVAAEPLDQAIDRIAAVAGLVTAWRRPVA